MSIRNESYAADMFLPAIAMLVMMLVIAILSLQPAETAPGNGTEARVQTEWIIACRTSEARLVEIIPSRSTSAVSVNEVLSEWDYEKRATIAHSVRMLVSGMTFKELVLPSGIEKIRILLAGYGFDELKIVVGTTGLKEGR